MLCLKSSDNQAARGGGRGRHGRGEAGEADDELQPDGADGTRSGARPSFLWIAASPFDDGPVGSHARAVLRAPGTAEPLPGATPPAECLARKSFSKPLKRLKMDSGVTRRAHTSRKPRAAALAGQRPGPTPHRPKVSGLGVTSLRRLVVADVVMPANAGIHGGERRNWRSGARARAKVLDPRFRGDDRRDASSVSGPPPWQLRRLANGAASP